MKVFKTMVGSGTTIFMCDTIEHAGGLWLVPRWLEDKASRTRTPIRIIRMDVLAHQKASFGGSDYMLNAPIPTAVLEGATTVAQGVQYEVVEDPPIRITLPDLSQH